MAEAASEIGLKSRGQLHDIENGRAKCSLRTATKIHRWARRLADAGDAAGQDPPTIAQLCPKGAELLREAGEARP